MYTRVFLLLKFIRHHLRARSRFDLHSPFIYQFYKDILKDPVSYTEYTRVEHLRTAMRSHPGFIRMTDFGSKSSGSKWNKKIIRMRHVALHSSVSPAYGQLLFRIARFFKPETILELGTSLGISTSYLAMGNPKGKVITIEGCRETAELARINFDHLGLRNITQVTGNFDEILPEVLLKSGKIKLAFIDGNHRKEPTMSYFFQIVNHIDQDSVLIFDDIHWSQEMDQAWRMICSHESVKVSIDLFRMGIVFFSERLSKEDFILKL